MQETLRVVVVTWARVVVTITGARVVVGGLVVVLATVAIGAFVTTDVVFSVVVEQAVKSRATINKVFTFLTRQKYYMKCLCVSTPSSIRRVAPPHGVADY